MSTLLACRILSLTSRQLRERDYQSVFGRRSSASPPVTALWARVVRDGSREECTAFDPDRYQPHRLACANGNRAVEERRRSQVVAEYGAVRQDERSLPIRRQVLLDRVLDGAIGEQQFERHIRVAVVRIGDGDALVISERTVDRNRETEGFRGHDGLRAHGAENRCRGRRSRLA